MDSPVVGRPLGRSVVSVRFGSQSDNHGISCTEDSSSPPDTVHPASITIQLVAFSSDAQQAVDVQFVGASDIETGSSNTSQLVQTSSEPQSHAEGGDSSSPSEGNMLPFFRFLEGFRWLRWSHSTPLEEVIKMAKINLLFGIGLYSTTFSTVFTFPSILFTLYVILATLGILFSYIVIHAGPRLHEPCSQALLDASTVTLLAALLMIPAMAVQKLMVNH